MISTASGRRRNGDGWQIASPALLWLSRDTCEATPGSWFPSNHGEASNLGVETVKAEEAVEVTQLDQRDQIGIGPVHVPLLVVIHGTPQERVVVDGH